MAPIVVRPNPTPHVTQLMWPIQDLASSHTGGPRISRMSIQNFSGQIFFGSLDLLFR
jgi:hypothetical protein